MSYPGSPGSYMPPDASDYGRRMADIETAIRQLQASALGKGDLYFSRSRLQSTDFDGDLDAGSPGTTGWAIGGANGNAVFNDLTVRAGTFAAQGQAASGFGVPAAGAVVVSRTIAVPAGFSRALVHASGSISAVEANGSPDYLYWEILIDGTGSAATLAYALPNQPAALSGSSVRSLSGLAGGSIVIAGRARASGADWSAQGPNVATVSASIVWQR